MIYDNIKMRKRISDVIYEDIFYNGEGMNQCKVILYKNGPDPDPDAETPVLWEVPSWEDYIKEENSYLYSRDEATSPADPDIENPSLVVSTLGDFNNDEPSDLNIDLEKNDFTIYWDASADNDFAQENINAGNITWAVIISGNDPEDAMIVEVSKNDGNGIIKLAETDIATGGIISLTDFSFSINLTE